MKSTINSGKRKSSDLFLCHSSKDKEKVRKLARDLHELQIYVWFDEWELEAGDSLHDKIGDALENVDYVGVVLSPDSVDSKWCKEELKQALSREKRTNNKVVIPLLLRHVQPPAFLEDKLYLEFSDEGYYKSITKLAGQLHGLSAKNIAIDLEDHDLKSLNDVESYLIGVGYSAARSIGRENWSELLGVLRKHDVDITSDRLSIIDFKTMRKDDLC